LHRFITLKFHFVTVFFEKIFAAEECPSASAWNQAPPTSALLFTLHWFSMSCTLSFRYSPLLLFHCLWATLPLHAQGDTTGLAAATQGAQMLFQAGKLDTAQLTAQDLLLRQRRCFGDSAAILVPTISLLGSIQFEKGAYLRAAEHYQHALGLMHGTGDGLQEASLRSRLGRALLYTGEHDRALQQMETALLLQQRVLPAAHPDIGKTYLSIGLYWKTLRRYHDALHYFEHALGVALRHRRDSSFIAYCYSEAGQALLSLKNHEKALDYFQQEDQIMLSAGHGQHPTYAYTCHDLGLAYARLGRYEEALAKEKQALALIQSASKGINPLASSFQLYIGRAYLALGRYQDAVDMFETDKASLLQYHGGEVVTLFHSEAGLGNAYFQWHLRTQGRDLLAQSRLHFEEAARHLGKAIRFESNTVRRRRRLYEALGVFEAAIAVEEHCFRTQNDPVALERAWQLSEMLHGYTLLASAQETEALRHVNIPDSLLAQEKKLKSILLGLENQRLEFVGKRGLPPTDPAVLQTNQAHLAAQGDYERFVQLLEATYPDYFQLKYATQAASLTETRRSLAPGQCLLEYLVGDSSLFAFVLRPDTALFFRFPLDYPLNSWVSDLRMGISAHYVPAAGRTAAPYEATLRQYVDAARNLYDKLVAPLEPFLSPTVFIVPDGEIHAIPFEALLSAAPKDVANFKTYPFWLRQRTISLAYSATVFVRAKKRPQPSLAKGMVLALAPFEEALPGERKASESRTRQYSRLPRSGEEGRSAVERMGGESLLLVGSAAGKEQFLRLADKYRILHLATHAVANSKNGTYSRLVFAADSALYAGEVYALVLRCALVVLSACETGMGEVQRGEGVLSLAQAFGHAGGRNVLTTLWPLGDGSAAHIMSQFYQGLSQKMPVNEALGAAKRQYLLDRPGLGAHPFFWAGFVLFGDGDGLE
jgi:CHAT domain-containing protein